MLSCDICAERKATHSYWAKNGRVRIIHRCDVCRDQVRERARIARRAKMEAHGLWRPKAETA